MSSIFRPPIRSLAMLEAARDTACVRCGRKDGTVVAAHYSGCGKLAVAQAGAAQKGHDLLVADLCMDCHAYFDQHRAPNGAEGSLDFALCVFRTLVRRRDQGVITIQGDTHYAR